MFYCIVLYCIVLYCIVLYCIVLYCIVLYCIVLYCIAVAQVQYPVMADMIYLLLKPGSQHLGLCIPCESENHVDVGPVSIWHVIEPLRTTSTLSAITLNASIERWTWCKCCEKD